MSYPVRLYAQIFPTDELQNQIRCTCEKILGLKEGTLSEDAVSSVDTIQLHSGTWYHAYWLMDALREEAVWCSDDGNGDECEVTPDGLRSVLQKCEAVLADHSKADDLLPYDFMDEDEYLASVKEVAEDLKKVLDLYGDKIDYYRVSLG